MCDPVSAGIATAVGAAASLYGSYQQNKTATANANALAEQNRATVKAQNEGFTTRLNAGLARTQAESAASRETLAARDTAADLMRSNQMSSLKNYQDLINEQNTTAESLRATGDTAAQTLLANTSAQSLADAQTSREQQAADLLAQSGIPEGPGPTDPSGTNAVGRDLVAGGALARRTAEAATNIRDYGSKISKVGAYAAPGQEVALDVAANKYGIMPAQTAEKLLTAGSATRLLPTKVAYNAATGLGQAQDLLEQSRGQGALDAAALSYGNAADIANLQQTNATTIASNTAKQTAADLEAKKSQAGMISGLGQLALYGAGYYGGGSLSSLFGGSSSTPNNFASYQTGIK